MHIHDLNAINTRITFRKSEDIHVDVQASRECCWNCLWSVMTYDGLWCDCEMQEVDYRDLCRSWEGEAQAVCA